MFEIHYQNNSSLELWLISGEEGPERKRLHQLEIFFQMLYQTFPKVDNTNKSFTKIDLCNVEEELSQLFHVYVHWILQ